MSIPLKFFAHSNHNSNNNVIWNCNNGFIFIPLHVPTPAPAPASQMAKFSPVQFQFQHEIFGVGGKFQVPSCSHSIPRENLVLELGLKEEKKEGKGKRRALSSFYSKNQTNIATALAPQYFILSGTVSSNGLAREINLFSFCFSFSFMKWSIFDCKMWRWPREPSRLSYLTRMDGEWDGSGNEGDWLRCLEY